MKVSLEKKLYDKFPKLFKSLDNIGCDDGWFSLIYSCSEELEKLDTNIQYLQIKEKFGNLRIYFLCLSDNKEKSLMDLVSDVIQKYEKKSSLICERCGQTGESTKTKYNWTKTLCEECIKENINP
jgi:transcription elongation factor Elf1